jgi:NAD+ diphosphatase
MIQEIAPRKLDNSYKPRDPKNGDYVFSYSGSQIITKPDRTFFRYEECSHSGEYIYLFAIDDTAFYLADLHSLPHAVMSTQEIRTYEPKYLGFAAITGWQLYGWMNDNRFCGRCGTVMISDEKERAMRCPSCGNIVYPRINPAVIVGIKNDKDQLLVTKYAGGSYHKYALVAGYTEIGETIEETVIREVKEETGLDVTDIEYDRCQPWSFTSTLLFGFWCRTSGSDEIHMDKSELRLARWADREEELPTGSDASLTSYMINKFLKGLA